ncbi:MAG: SIS domain-containing protein [Gemmatimonadales bacterium]|nr:SIS domain-containing protein [Gemmatimonadales bacterium]
MTVLGGQLDAPAPPARGPELVRRRFARSIEVSTRFFEANVDEISRACLEMARRFQAGGRLLVFGEGAEATDAHHMAVEFVHPVIVGKRALPAIALTSDVAVLTGHAASNDVQGFARVLDVLGRSQDIAVGLSRDGHAAAVVAGLRRARSRGLLTVGLAGGDGGRMRSAGGADFLFVVPEKDFLIVQEVHETLYHVLWELVHVFFEQRVLT